MVFAFYSAIQNEQDAMLDLNLRGAMLALHEGPSDKQQLL